MRKWEEKYKELQSGKLDTRIGELQQKFDNKSITREELKEFEKAKKIKENMSKIENIERITKREMKGFKDDRIEEVRIMGGCLCVEVKDEKFLEGFQEFAYKRGVFSRPFLKYMYAMVPYIINENELVQVIDTMKAWFLR